MRDFADFLPPTGRLISAPWTPLASHCCWNRETKCLPTQEPWRRLARCRDDPGENRILERLSARMELNRFIESERARRYISRRSSIAWRSSSGFFPAAAARKSKTTVWQRR